MSTTPSEMSFKKGDMSHKLLEQSSFAILFPNYREKYLEDHLNSIKQILNPLCIEFVLNTKDSTMTVNTTDATWDPVAILRARDMIRLLARSVPLEEAKKVLEDDIFSQVFIMGNDIRKKERFAKRRQRLIGPNGSTLKALQLLTGCYILIHGKSCSVIGSEDGIRTVQEVVNDSMRNIHPVYHIRSLMVKRELKKNPEVAEKDWSELLPKYKKSGKSKKVKHVERKGKGQIPDFPKETDVDHQIETGEYFLKKKTKRKRKHFDEQSN